jgi:hypothetical protein
MVILIAMIEDDALAFFQEMVEPTVAEFLTGQMIGDAVASPACASRACRIIISIPARRPLKVP